MACGTSNKEACSIFAVMSERSTLLANVFHSERILSSVYKSLFYDGCGTFHPGYQSQSLPAPLTPRFKNDQFIKLQVHLTTYRLRILEDFRIAFGLDHRQHQSQQNSVSTTTATLRSSQVLLAATIAAMALAAPAKIARGTLHTTNTTISATNHPNLLSAIFSRIGPVSTDIPALTSTIGTTNTPVSKHTPVLRHNISVTTVTHTVSTSSTKHATVIVTSGTVPPIHLPQNIFADPKPNVGVPTCNEWQDFSHSHFQLGNFPDERTAGDLMGCVLMDWLSPIRADEEVDRMSIVVTTQPEFRQPDDTWSVSVDIPHPRCADRAYDVACWRRPLWNTGMIARAVKKETGLYPLIKMKQMVDNGCYDPQSMCWGPGGKC